MPTKTPAGAATGSGRLRGGSSRPREDAGDRHSASDDAEDDFSHGLASTARSQLQLVMRSINSSSEVIEANNAMRAVPEALARSGAAAFSAMRAAPAIFSRMMMAARMSQEQLQTLCRRLGFHPAVAGALYYSLQATTASGAVFALGFVIFSLQALAGGIAMLMSVLGAFGSTMLLGGAAGTAVVGGSIVVPAFVLSSGSAILVFVAGVVSRDGRRLRRSTGRRAARELPGRVQELLPASEQTNDSMERQDHDREQNSDTRSRHRSGSRRERDRASGVRGSREERREAREEERREGKVSSKTVRVAAPPPAQEAEAAAAAEGRSEAAQPLPPQLAGVAVNSSGAEQRGAYAASAAHDMRGASLREHGSDDASAAQMRVSGGVDDVIDGLHLVQPNRAAVQRSAPPPPASTAPSVPNAVQSTAAAAMPTHPQQPPPAPTAAPQPSDGSPQTSAHPAVEGTDRALGDSRPAAAGRSVQTGFRALAPRDLEASLSQQSRDALGKGKAFLL
jgi:hypothetical protein